MSSPTAVDAVRPEDATSDLPRAVGRYDLLHEIASGGMATVYLGRARGAAGFGRFVAIKCCHPHLRKQEEFATMFVDEARLAATIHHPNVVATLDVSEDSAATLYLVMEYVDGYSLGQVIRAARDRGERLPPAVAARIVADALLGLHAAHELRDSDGRPQGIVHRDVSPHNVLVGVDGVARIMDFGIAKAESRLTVTRDGSIKGKLGYMAPEQHGLGLPENTPLPSVDRRADLYAAGVMLWEALTGERLFQGDSDAETVKLVVRGVPKRPSELLGSQLIPPALDAVVMRALERDPARRFATAEQFAAALEGCGLALPSARGVSAHLHTLLAPAIASRRAVLAQFREVVDGPDASAITPRALAANALRGEEATINSVTAMNDIAVREPSALVRLGAGRRAWLLAGAAGALVACAALAVLLLLRPAPRTTSALPATRAATATPPPAVTPPPAAPTAQPATTPPVVPQSDATAETPRSGRATRGAHRPSRRALPPPPTPSRGRYRPQFL